MVQVLLIAESMQLQATLNTYGIQTQTPSEIEPVEIWSQWEMVKVFNLVGQNEYLGLTGRPRRPMGTLSTSLVYIFRSRYFVANSMAALCYLLQSKFDPSIMMYRKLT